MTINMQPTTGLKESIEQRRAARSFHSDAIPKALLEEILRLSIQ
jgi:nitroreductase